MTAKDLGPLDWRTAIVDKEGRPSPEFQRRWNTQRNNNALIGTVGFGSGAPTSTPDDGAEYVDVSATPMALYIGHSGTWHLIGIQKFTDLVDVPHSYSGHTGNIVRVNSGGTALEFVTLTSILDGLGSTQGDILYRDSSGWAALTPGTAGNILTSGGPSANPSWAAGGGGGSLIKLATVTLGSNSSGVTVMSSIPQTYTNLKLIWRLYSTGTNTSGSDSLCLQFNGDTGSHYQDTAFGWFGPTPTTYGFGTGNSPTAFGTSYQLYGLTQNLANFPPGYGEIDIYNYAQSTYAIGIIGKSVCMQNNTGIVANHSVGYWNNTSGHAAITSIVAGPSANQLLAGGVLTLYGVI